MVTPADQDLGSPWDEDKAMMDRWGLSGMRSFEQTSVAKKEGERLTVVPGSPEAPSATTP